MYETKAVSRVENLNRFSSDTRKLPFLLEVDMPTGVYEKTEEHKEKMREALLKRYESGEKFGFQKGHKLNIGNQYAKGNPPNKGCFKKGQTGNKCVSWKGGIKKHGGGYIFIHSPAHPFRNSQNYVFEHRLVMEKHLGRYLTKKERVHHLGEKDDNRLHMLMLFKNITYHQWFHRKNGNYSNGIIFDGRLIRKEHRCGKLPS